MFCGECFSSQEEFSAAWNFECIKNGLKKGLIANFENSKFTEYMVEVDRNSYITNDDESLFSFGEIMEPIKKELIYVENG